MIEGLVNEILVRDNSAREIFPAIQPMIYSQAVESALASLQTGEVETRWCDALYSSQGDQQPVKLISEEGMLLEQRQNIAKST